MLTVRYIDVGQGDCELITSPDGENMLIDAGPGSEENMLSDYLKNCGVSEIKYMIITHPHDDHTGGADLVFDSFKIENVIMPDCNNNSEVYKNIINSIENEGCGIDYSAAGTSYSLSKDITFSVLAPLSDSYSDLNNYSIVLKLEYGDTSFMFTGDASDESEDEMLEEYTVSQLDCDVLKVGHHGSSTSTSEEFLDAVSPDIAVISCGKNNSYGLPQSTTLEKLSECNITYFRTDRNGTIILQSDGTKIYTH